jgi:hypothetical protein
LSWTHQRRLTGFFRPPSDDGLRTEFTRAANLFMLRTFWILRWRRFSGGSCGKLKFRHRRANQALQDLLDLRVTRYPHFIFLPHIWRLRHNLSAYDAAYVALTEKLGATLITREARLASASTRGVSIEVF